MTIQQWTETHFEKISLTDMGLILQLGHNPGEFCPLPRYSSAKKFVVIDIDGVHTMQIQYCGCGKADPSYDIQLLASRLYPATTSNPETCATFRALEHFQMLSFMSKVGISMTFVTKNLTICLGVRMGVLSHRLSTD